MTATVKNFNELYRTCISVVFVVNACYVIRIVVEETSLLVFTAMFFAKPVIGHIQGQLSAIEKGTVESAA